MSKKKSNNIVAVDLFCGVGGLTHGLESVGINVVAGFDCDASCQYAYTTNNNAQFIHADLSAIASDRIRECFGNADLKILVGCAPCQTFSAQSRKIRKQKNLQQDPRWNLLNSFSKFIEDIQPEIVSMENVPELHNFEIFKHFCDILHRNKYSVDYHIVDCSSYGLPQKRRRLVLLASSLGRIQLLPPEYFGQIKKRTVRDVLTDMPALKCGETDKNDVLHRSAGLTPINLERIRHSKQGGTWKDWPERLRINCHKKDSGQNFTSVYGRMEWDKPAPTITTQFFYIGAGRFGHPEQDRAISLREGALLQTFPPKYKFIENSEKFSIATISRHIGNAVPVDLGKIIGISINKHLEEVFHARK